MSGVDKHLVLTGPSGSGKSTIVGYVLTGFPFRFCISHTTRMPREDEEDGVDYFFTTKEVFEEMIRNDEIIEYVNYNGNYYGTSVSQIDADEDRLLLDLEYKGVLHCKEKYPGFVVVYIDCKKEIACERLNARMNGKKRDEIEGRMRLYDEFGSIKDKCDYIIDNSNSLEDSKRRIADIICKEFGLHPRNSELTQ
ncbi:guanylate kinase [Ordospora colligata]|uniref:Guanylate kinase n=1 Tax=Ordospora colligata OC4 TaxID=1354746 RepID=A0A0B2UHB1_9MICR|nr:guanylate kinase [Ordospora colligata OC4]KHN70461.1 guanylate kinase [Ordospora colligata OC4]TBU17211.1 guanylate kinase [Ordospora colligata]TBU17461.1 guanylate kinase [Ordospora colligata]TBU19641.1 guanylate kinase [Ordospora colligata]